MLSLSEARSFLLSVRFATPPVLRPDRAPLQLDALLLAALQKRHGLNDERNLADLPLASFETSAGKIPLASCAHLIVEGMPLPEGGFLEYGILPKAETRVRKFNPPCDKLDFLDFSEASDLDLTFSGVSRYAIRLNRLTPLVGVYGAAWLAMGDPEIAAELLTELPGLGSARNTGEGTIIHHTIKIEPVPKPWLRFGATDDVGAPLRAIPVGAWEQMVGPSQAIASRKAGLAVTNRSPTRPPYWSPSGLIEVVQPPPWRIALSEERLREWLGLGPCPFDSSENLETIEILE